MCISALSGITFAYSATSFTFLIFAMIVPPSSVFYRTLDEAPSLPAAENGKTKPKPAPAGGKRTEDYPGAGAGPGQSEASAERLSTGDCPVHPGGRAGRWHFPARYRVMLLLVWGFAVQMALRVVLNVTIIAMEAPSELTPLAEGRTGDLRLPLGATAVSRPVLPWEALLPVSVDTRWPELRSTAADGKPARAQLLQNCKILESEPEPELEPEPEPESESESESEYVPVPAEVNETSSVGGGLQLDSLSRGLVLSSFYWGYMVSQVPGGRLADRLGARRVLGVSLGATSLLALLLPPAAARAGAAGVVAVRLLQGLATGPVLPSLFPLLARWLPADERQTACALITAAQLLAVAAVSPAATRLSVTLGWQSVFYVTGGAGLLWLLVWALCMRDSPAQHPAACACELRRIGSAAAAPAAAAVSPPYCAILGSAPVWAIVLCEAANSWGQQLLVTLVPLYLKDAVGLDLHTSGLLSGVPHLGRALLGLLLGLNGDLALRRRWLAPLTLRRLATLASCGGVSVCLLALPLVVHLQPAVTAALFCLAGLATAFSTVGHPLSTIEISPTFCGTVFGLANTVGGAASLLSPLAAGAILDGSTGAALLAGWRLVFWLAAAVYVVGMIAFLAMASADRQPWDAGTDDSQEKQPIVETDDQDEQIARKC